MTHILKFINEDGENVASVNINNEAFDQLSTECPVLSFNDGKYQYRDSGAAFADLDGWIEYEPVREFTVTVDDDRNATVFETAEPTNILGEG